MNKPLIVKKYAKLYSDTLAHGLYFWDIKLHLMFLFVIYDSKSVF